MQFEKQYFIDKFSVLKDKDIGKGSLERHCVLWHCGIFLDANEYMPTDEAKALAKLLGFRRFTDLIAFNDTSENPRQRILEALQRCTN